MMGTQTAPFALRGSVTRRAGVNDAGTLFLAMGRESRDGWENRIIKYGLEICPYERFIAEQPRFNVIRQLRVTPNVRAVFHAALQEVVRMSEND